MKVTRSAARAFTLTPPIGTSADGDDPSRQWEDAFIDFLSGAAKAITEPAVVVLQTNDFKGLSLVTELTPMDYAYLLLGCGIVSVVNKNNMHNDVEVHLEKFKDMLKRRNLMGDKESESYCFVSKGRVYEAALKEMRPENAPPVSTTKEATMVTLRIGKTAPGGKAPSGQTSINKREPPPKFSWKMRSVHQRFHRKIGPLTTAAYFDEKMRSDARVVRDWMVDPPQFFKRKYVGKNKVDVTKAKAPTDSPEKKKPKKIDSTNESTSMPKPKNNTPTANATDTGLPEVVTQEFKDDLIAVLEKHGMLNHLKQSLMTTAKTDLSSSPLEAATPFHGTTAASVEETTPIIPKPPQQIRVTPSDLEKEEFPLLSQVDPRVLRRGSECVGGMDMDQIRTDTLLREVLKLKSKLGEEAGFESENSRHQHKILDVPMTIKDNKKVPDMKSTMRQLMDMADPDSRDEMVETALHYLLTSHNGASMKALREERIAPKIMDEFDCACTIDEAGLKIWQWEKVKQCLKLFLDVDNVSVAKDKLQAMSKDHGTIIHGTYNYFDPKKPEGTAAEKIRYWWKDPVYETLASITGLINGHEDLRPDLIEWIHIAYGGDHGKGKFRFAGKVLIRTKSGKYYDDVFGLADVACKKDNGIVLDNTVLPHLAEGINEMEESRLLFVANNANNDDAQQPFSIDVVNQETATAAQLTEHYLKPSCFLAGDLAFLAIIMGKEDFSSAWCNWCDLDHNTWAEKDHEPGELWTTKRILEQHLLNETKGWKDERRKGIRRTPYTKIPFCRIIFSVLHAMIGVGDLIMSYVEAYVEGEIEQKSPQEMQLHNALVNKTAARAEAHNDWELWKESFEGGKLLDRYRRRVQYIEKTLIKRLDARINNMELPDAERTNASTEKQALIAEKTNLIDNEIPRLVEDNKRLKSTWEMFDKDISGLKDKLKEYTKSRRTEEASYYTGVDRIFQDEGANRAAHFGRKFNGVNLRTIMEKAKQLFGANGRIRKYLIEKAPTKADMTNKVCEDVMTALVLWDSAFSKLRTVDPSASDCDEAQKNIDLAVAQLRKMGISITPKVHGTQFHAVYQMRTIPGGIAKLAEDWVEQYHQSGFRYDLCYCRVGDLKQQAVIRSRAEHRARNPKVVMRKDMLDKRFKGMRKRKQDMVKDMKKQIKQELRHEVLGKVWDEDLLDLY